MFILVSVFFGKSTYDRTGFEFASGKTSSDGAKKNRYPAGFKKFMLRTISIWLISNSDFFSSFNFGQPFFIPKNALLNRQRCLSSKHSIEIWSIIRISMTNQIRTKRTGFFNCFFFIIQFNIQKQSCWYSHRNMSLGKRKTSI